MERVTRSEHRGTDCSQSWDAEGLRYATAHILRIAATDQFSKDQLGGSAAGVRAYVQDAGRTIIAMLETTVLAGGPQYVNFEARWPADWWQALRERWFPGWWLRRWPVRYETHKVEEKYYARVCPHIAVPELRDHVRFLTDWKPLTEVPRAK